VANQFSKIRAIVFDLDGTVYEGKNLVDGVFEAINSLGHQGFEIYFCTNNSTRTRQEIANKLIHLGIETTSDSVFSAGYAAAHYLASAGIKQVSLLGTPSLKNELCAAGLTVVDELNKGQALVVGLDPTINYSSMSLFATLHGKDMPVIACNRDRWFPGNNRDLKPGCGIMVDLVEALLGRCVDLVVGKPNTLLLEMLSRQSGLDKDELLIIGDSLKSDVALAEAFGSSWVLYAPRGCGDSQDNSIATMTDLPGMIMR
jgi:HAD superfamily hydrolase (TIGR01450 family)